MHPADPRVALLRDHLVGYVLHGTDGIRFHLRQLIGEGGQGWIYKGNYDEPDGVPIVIKVLRPDSVTDETLRRFQREAAVLRQLGAQANPNPNLVRFYDHGIVQLSPPNSSPLDKVALPFTVLEYVHGVTLAQLVQDQQGSGLAAGRTRRLLRQVAFALTSVHAQNIIHRDLKPSNILVTVDHETEIVKVTDFGLAKLVDFNAQKTTMLAGASLGYAPPEQYEKGNERVTPRTDVFSFAAILFECLTGAPAYAYRSGESPMRLIQEMISGPRPSLAARANALPVEIRQNQQVLAGLDTHLKHALQANPDDRPASVREFWDAVDPLLRTASDVSLQPSVPVPLVARQRPRESINPSQEGPSTRYVFRVLGGLSRRDELKSAVVSADGSTVFALGALGVYRWTGSSWTVVPSPGWLDPAILHGIALLPDSALLVFGGRGTVVMLSPSGDAQPWRLPDDDVDVRGAMIERTGIVLVGRRRSAPKGAWIDAQFGRPPIVRTVETTSTLHGVTRLTTGALLACGDDGALARIDVSTTPVIPWGRTGHLLAVASRPDGGAFAVGTGGHALALSPNLQATLEPVQTTRDLVSVAVAKDGSAWAGAAQRRVLQRRATTWARVPLDGDHDDPTVIISVKPLVDSSVLVFANDGQVLEGRPST
jgi:serine/threonine-protein kinase